MSTASAEARAQCAARLRICIGVAIRQEGKGTRAIRIDADLLSERTSLSQLDRNEAKIAAAITSGLSSVPAAGSCRRAVNPSATIHGLIDASGRFSIGHAPDKAFRFSEFHHHAGLVPGGYHAIRSAFAIRRKQRFAAQSITLVYVLRLNFCSPALCGSLL
jgi:hypothetical protein